MAFKSSVGISLEVLVPLIERVRLNPTFKIKGIVVVLHPLEIVSIANEHLGERVGSLSDEADAIMASLDRPFTRAFG